MTPWMSPEARALEREIQQRLDAAFDRQVLELLAASFVLREVDMTDDTTEETGDLATEDDELPDEVPDGNPEDGTEDE